uniref:Reverse transcriptase domain-containing protein n=1 Tax=Solanum lycopersicum TaxID=4081 RepID=A0A3Q7G6W9_SOLLC
MRPVTGWRVCMDYRKLNSWTEKDHFPMPFMDQMLDRLAGKGWYCFLDGYSGISIATEYQDKTTFTCPYGTFAFRKMTFGLCNAPATFQRCMMSIFSDMVEDTIEYCFLDGYSGYNQISIAPEDQEKTTLTCPYGTLRSEECRLGCAMHPQPFRDV